MPTSASGSPPRPAIVLPANEKNARAMALPRPLNRLELALPPTLAVPMEREALAALSQHKLNALGVPLAYVDRNQRYRFANRAFLDWLGKRANEVLGREVIEVLGREVH